MIHLENVCKSYPARMGRKSVINDVSIDFVPGRNTAIMGGNGAGKSTLMRLISGAEVPDSGKVERRASVSWPLGFRGGLHGSLTGRENLAFIARIYGRNYPDLLDFVEDFAEIGNYMQQPVRTYSSGMKARLSFGVSMAIQFDYYLIDEVIAVGDVSFKRKCKIVLSDRLKDSTVLLISHSTSIMKEFCQHGVVMENGRLLEFGSLNKAIKYYEASQGGA
ncbi:ABC transporter ATP-binding protein [Kumtagia ephedrae]|jgi:capsular polysaccharide transport system ATP-binding protein|uniref:ABC transporter ATP-binding protein n=1 Tax=Kumtagia ephedrae TaxID=2116701 RepID=A0A2P7RNI8_9HYPH|nr:ABC transporter ATP-binding protein [Mesorhizobium ephedrae]PSJ51760.1 ABC transporter ATP-binding protein [Mesorhizobium ephedrae]